MGRAAGTRRDGRLLINPAWINPSALSDFELIEVPPEEPWAANVCPVSSTVLLAAAHQFQLATHWHTRKPRA